MYVKGVTTGSITYSLIIDKLPSEDGGKVAKQIEEALKVKSNTLKVVSYIRESNQGKGQSGAQTVSPSAINAPIVILIIFACNYVFIQPYLFA